MKYPLFVAALLALALTACGQKEEAAATPVAPAIAEPAPAPLAPAEPSAATAPAADVQPAAASASATETPDATLKMK